MSETFYALSVKQPWAALIVHGIKTIEIRRWSTEIRGPILIHASKEADERPEVWRLLPDRAAATAELRGGIIGRARLLDCVAYRSRKAFSVDRKKHLNRPEWFRAPALFGFQLRSARRLPFRRLPGLVGFFSVKWDVQAKPQGREATQLLLTYMQPPGKRRQGRVSKKRF